MEIIERERGEEWCHVRVGCTRTNREIFILVACPKGTSHYNT